MHFTENFRPIKLLHRRAGQSLCLTSYNNILDIEWYDNEDIDIEKIEEPQEEHKESVILVIESISEWTKISIGTGVRIEVGPESGPAEGSELTSKSVNMKDGRIRSMSTRAKPQTYKTIIAKL
ncbi:hypothetical protein EVAR_74235_1 [Eumeta japonica]|uniref:Uncharacterized protein n=1 Tax=Eumeta variegata TaxID=151549 RepID=A0A4C1SF86_EUMVA|nr:hypothetical protein EVAR_74235_1 [Eumeta japonica]